MRWLSAMFVGAILAILLPMMLGGRDGAWMASEWTRIGTIHPFKQSPGLLFSIPVFLIASIGLRLFFNWHRN